jgi:hypothetical protein
MKTKALALGAVCLLAGVVPACSGGSASPSGHAGAGGQAGAAAAGTGGGGTAGATGTAGAMGTAGTTGDAGSGPVAGAGGGVVDAGADASTITGAAGGDASADRQTASEVGTAPVCPATIPAAPGATIDVRAPATLAGALATAQAGDRIVLHAGAYAQEKVSKRKFASFVFVEAAAGEAVTMAGATFTSCDHLAISGVTFTATVMLDGSSNFAFHKVTLDGGATEDAALQIHGQGSAGASHDVLVEDSTIKGGGRTIFVLGVFAPSDGWNHHLTFLRDDITCGSHNCFQVSGGRDMIIDGNRINGTTTAGVLTAGATRVSITRNRFKGMVGMSPCATQIASPGMEWDNYAGVENMISSAIVIANNVVDGWGTALQLDAARDVAFVYNTVADGKGITFDHRTPHDQKGNVILDGNSNIRAWNNLMPSLSIATGEMRPAFESNNVVWKGGGGGANLVTTAPTFAPSGAAGDYLLAAGSVGIDGALVNAETPLVDFDNRPRGAKPDVGAHELGATAPVCP